MKKLLVVLTVLAICVLLAAGCGGTKPTASPTPSATPTPTLNPSPTPTPTPTLTPSPTPTPTLTPTPSPTPTPTPSPTTTPSPTAGPDSLVVSADIFTQQNHQIGEILVAPGETFTVNLAVDRMEGRDWVEEPEIINAGVVELVDLVKSPKDNPKWLTWSYRAQDKGFCVVHFKTVGSGWVISDSELREWTYTLAVGTTPQVGLVTLDDIPTEPNGREMSDNVTDITNMYYSEIERNTYGLHDILEGELVNAGKYEQDIYTGWYFEKGQSTFTGKVDGKAGTFTGYSIYWGTADAPDYMTGRGKGVMIIISGTGELADLRGILYSEVSFVPGEPPTDPTALKTTLFYSGTIWYLE